MIDVKSVINNLSLGRPVFHSEADFQHALAWTIHKLYPSSNVRLEVPVVTSLGTLYVDVLVRLSGAIHYFELKYKSRAIEITSGDEKYQLQNHGAQPLGRYDFLKDVRRLETMVDAAEKSTATAIILTNDSAYWHHARSTTDTSAAFSLGDGRSIFGVLDWSARASKGTKRGREEPIALRGKYVPTWQDYSSVPSKYYSEFRYLPVSIR